LNLQSRNLALYELSPGSTLGKYEILRKLATGGMAELYIARVRGVAGFEKTVVLKRILPQVATDGGVVQMFLDEARLAATLQHPNIADVYDVGEVDGSPFFTMEYVHGQDVRSIRSATRKRGEVLPLAMALAIVHGTASALDYAHERTGPDGGSLGLVHRDVSPSNIIVSYDGAIKLLDFGIARAASNRHRTQVGSLKGKTPYMSPEQCRAQSLDRRSDLFSLGVVLFELTVGRRPFRGDSDFEIMEQIVLGGAPAPSSIVAGYPEALEVIVMRLLARRPDDRYQTAEELIHDLEELIAAHQLWVSPKMLGKYMRLLFAERVEAWERAAHDGVSLGEHVAETVTSESQRAEMVTPPSALAVVPRRLQELAAARPRVSAELAAVQPRVSAELAAVQPRVSAELPIAQPSVDTAVTSAPRVRTWRRGLVLAVAAVLVGAAAGGIYAWPKLSGQGRGGSASAPVPAAAPVVVEMAAQPAAAPAAPAQPAPAQPPQQPQAQPPSTAPPAATVKRPTPPPPPARPAKPPAKKLDRPAKESEWDPNSPFLPSN
jgi:serine/threonine protein kinase